MSALARALVEAERTVERFKSNLANAEEQARKLREETIPAAMHELGVKELKLITGETLGIKQEVYASIANDNKELVFNRLDANGFGGLIKTAVVTEFGRGDKQDAIKLFVRLHDDGLDVGMEQSVHPSTLKAFLREQLAAGRDIPLDLFGARPVWTTTLKAKPKG